MPAKVSDKIEKLKIIIQKMNNLLDRRDLSVKKIKVDLETKKEIEAVRQKIEDLYK